MASKRMVKYKMEKKTIRSHVKTSNVSQEGVKSGTFNSNYRFYHSSSVGNFWEKFAYFFNTNLIH